MFKICDYHMGVLTELIKERGLDSTNMPEMMLNTIYSRAYFNWPDHAMQAFRQGTTVCPVCTAMDNPCTCGAPDCVARTAEMLEHNWTVGLADNAYKYAVKSGYIVQN